MGLHGTLLIFANTLPMVEMLLEDAGNEEEEEGAVSNIFRDGFLRIAPGTGRCCCCCDKRARLSIVQMCIVVYFSHFGG